MSAMTNHPVNSPMMGRSRDIKRRLEVIQKKMADLQELGVPCAFCYTSVRNTGSLFTIGNKAITQIMEHSKDAILIGLQQQTVSSLSDHHTITDNKQNIAPEKPHTSTNTTNESHQLLDHQKELQIVLPPLPQPLSDTSLHDLHVLIVGIIKDLGIKWSDTRPVFWPAAIPFIHPQTAPEGFQGSTWTNALRDVLRSIYLYFGYNIDTYHIDQAVIERSRDIRNRSHDTPNGHHQYSSVESDDVDEEEEDDEIDVVNESSSIDEISSLQTHSDGGLNHLSATSSSGSSYVTLNYPSTRSHDSHMTDRSDRERDDRVSVSSDDPNISSTDNYFYYELAQGDSLESSPRDQHASLSTTGTLHRQHDVTSDASTTPSPKPHPLITTQSPFLYCTPQLYSQLYPATLHTAAATNATPFLLQPNLLLKAPNPLIFPVTGTNSDTHITNEENNGVIMSPSIKSPSLTTLPYTLSRRSLPIPPPSSNPTHSTTTTQQLIPTSNITLKNTVTKEIHTSPGIRNSKNAPLPISSSNNTAELPQLQEGKNKKGRNHGIYIYTNPSEPLKFMSLGSNEATKATNKTTPGPGSFNKGSDRKLTYTGEKLVTMGTSVAPPNRMTRPPAETSLVKDSKTRYQHPQSMVSPNAITVAGTANKDNRQKSLVQNVPPSTSAGVDDDKSNTKKSLSGVKRRRELVFHWYHSPEQTVPSTGLPPPSKRINNPAAGTV